MYPSPYSFICKENNSMDLNEEKKEELMAAVVFSHCWFLRRTLQLVFITLVSLLVCYYLQFSIYWKTNLFSVCTHTLERKYAFLIFNGILALVAKSFLQASPPMYVSSCEFSSAANFDIVTAGEVVPIGRSIEPEKDVVIDQMVEDEPEQAHRDDAPEADQQEKEDIAMDLEQEDNEELNRSSEREEEEEQAGDDAEYLMAQHTTTTSTANEEYTSTDELNRRFEEFIRKMKEEIRIEAQMQLIVV